MQALLANTSHKEQQHQAMRMTQNGATKQAAAPFSELLLSKDEAFIEDLDDNNTHVQELEANLPPSPTHTLESAQLTLALEGLLMAAPRPLRAGDLLDILGQDGLSLAQVQRRIDELVERYSQEDRGFQLLFIPEQGYQFQTPSWLGPWVERMFAARPRPLSRAAQETLAIVAYRQPVSRADIEFIRGVDAGSILKSLLDRGLVETRGRRENAPGRPMTFGTAPEFLRVYGLTSLEDLPPLDSFQPRSDGVQQALGRLETVMEKGCEVPAPLYGEGDPLQNEETPQETIQPKDSSHHG